MTHIVGELTSLARGWAALFVDWFATWDRSVSCPLSISVWGTLWHSEPTRMRPSWFAKKGMWNWVFIYSPCTRRIVGKISSLALSGDDIKDTLLPVLCFHFPGRTVKRLPKSLSANMTFRYPPPARASLVKRKRLPAFDIRIDDKITFDRSSRCCPSSGAVRLWMIRSEKIGDTLTNLSIIVSGTHEE